VTAPRDDAAGPAVAEVAGDALHGSYCPKMCTFACPVTSATGRDDAVPWSFHRTVSDLATGRLPVVPDVADRLTACSGCLACQVPCAFDQDVPSQVRAGRAALVAAGAAPAEVAEAVAHVAAGRAPTGSPLPQAPAADTGEATTIVIAGCRDGASALAATVAVLRAAGERVTTLVPDGCCGALLDDLGARDAGDEARGRLRAAVPGTAARVVATDPHCLGAIRSTGRDATDLASHLATAVTEGRLSFPDATVWHATWHDPCVLARGEGVTDAPRRLLAAAGAELSEPEHAGERTGCSGAGLGMDQLDVEAAAATSAARARELGDGGVVTGCARAQQRLAAAGVDVTDLATALARRLVADAADDHRSTP
jgi:Fe-S oxidoreductase